MRGIAWALRLLQWKQAVSSKPRGIDFYPVRMLPTGMRPAADAALFLAILRLLRSERPAAIIGFTVKPNVYGSLAARICRIPVLNNITGLGTVFISKGPLESLVTALYRPALRKAEGVFFHNEDDRDLFLGRKIVRSAGSRHSRFGDRFVAVHPAAASGQGRRAGVPADRTAHQ